ncbi:uncharacterized protein LOC127738731 [Mytilus californianus]|uniref:uncharacterized protein LOC127738731 n=1 Tax=Mytilus californianus TaxID=6549 RepID=UPI002245B71A|nr:uncharacterized protein LOC127738731 [Mytilus californianus]
MAYSESIKKSQDILACGLCETDTKIKVKCMDCDLYMCQKCTDKVHAKFKNADLHDIVALKDIHSHTDDTDAESDFKPVKCKDHRKQMCCMYCLTCELLVCPMCIAKTHHLHQMEEIQQFCQKKIKIMKKLQILTNSKIEKFIKKSNLMGEIEKSKSFEIEQNILREEKQAREVQSKCLRLLKEHKENTERQAELISRKELEILEDKKDIETVIQQIENKYKLQNTEEFLEAVRNVHAKLDSIGKSTSPKSLNIKIQQYIPNYKIQTDSKTIEMEIQFEIKAKYELDMSEVSSITSDEDGNIWITNERNEIRKLQVKERIKTIKSIKTDHGDSEIRCLKKDIFIASSVFRQICHLAADDAVKVIKDLSPNKPYTLHVTDSEIIVGMDCSSVKNRTDIPIIMRLGFDGNIIKVHTNREKQILTRDVVLCCTTTNEGAICYIDSTILGDYKGDVVFMSRDGIIQWKYIGNSFIHSTEHPFTPIEVLKTKSKNFIVSDMYQNSFHILTAQGSLLTILNLTLLGIEKPGLMTIDVNGILWISSTEQTKELLRSVKFSGF